MAKEVRKTIGIFVNGKEVENNLKSIKAAIAKVSNELNKMTVGTDEYNAHAAKLSQLKKIYDDYKEELKDVREELEAGEKAHNNFVVRAGAMASVVNTGYSALQKFVSATQQYVDAYASIDKAMQDVAKASGLSREEIEQMNLALKDIDTTASNEELLKIAEIGGHLNLSKEELTRFTQATDQAMKTFGITAEEAADAFSRLRRTFKDAAKGDIADTIYSIGSSINALDSVGTVTEKNIMLFAEEIGKLPDYIKPSIQDVLALGGAFETAGIDAQTAASGYMRIMNTATQNIDKFTGVMKMSAEELKNLIKSNPAEFVLKLGESLKALPEDQIGEALKSMGLGSARLSATMGALIRNTDQFRKSLDLSNKEFESATAMTDEFNKLNNTSSAHLEKARKRMQELKVEIGQRLIPVITKITEMSAGTMQVAIQIGKWMVQNKGVVLKYAAAMTVLYAIRQKEVILAKKEAIQLAVEKAGVATATTFTNLFALAKARLTKNTLAAANAQKALKAAFASTPWGAIITLATTLAVTMFTMKKNTDTAVDAQQDLASTIEKNYNEEAFEIEKLRKLIDDENVSREEKLKAINRLKEIIPEYTAELSKEGSVTDQNTQAIDNYLSRLHDKIELEATEAKLKELYNDKADKRVEYEQKRESFLNSSLWFGYRKRRKESEEAAKAYEEAADAYDKMKDSYDEMTKRQMASGNSVVTNNTNGNGNVTNTNTSGGHTSSSSTKYTITDFDKELAAFRKRQQDATLGEWERTKNGIIEGYEELIKKAKSLGKDDAFLTALATERDNAIIAAGQKYIKDAGNAIEKILKEADEMLDSSSKDGKENKILEAVAGTQKQWDEKIKLVHDNYETIKKILEDDDELGADDPNKLTSEQRAIFQKGIKDSTKAELELTSEKMQAITNVIKQNVTDETKFITDKETELRRSRMSDYDRQIDEINALYDAKIDAKRKEIETLRQLQQQDGTDTESIQKQIDEIEKLIAKLEELKGSETANAGSNVWDKLLNIDWKNFKDNWQENLDLMTRALQEFANAAFDILNSISQIQANREQAELDQFIATQDEKSKALQRQLEDGIISQKYYNAQMDKMQKEKEAKEKKLQHDQFERERKANLAKVLIEGGLAVATAFAQYGWPWGLIPAALSTAMTVAQTAMIASQVNPYAKGGYIRKEQIALMGEEGQEWVASNRLLTDRKTAPLIAALEDYQRGNSRALEALSLSQPDWNGLSQSAKNISTTFAGSNAPVVNNYNSSTDNSEVLKELKQMNAYLKDPKNRQAYISRKMQLEFDRQENELKAMARL